MVRTSLHQAFVRLRDPRIYFFDNNAQKYYIKSNKYFQLIVP